MARVLIVDNAANLRRLYRLELEAEGYEIVDAGSGTEALEVLMHEKIDVMVLELMLPDGLGLQLMEEILSRHRHLPLVINTAYSQFRDNFQTWAADAFVVKSSDLAELKNALAQALAHHKEKATLKRFNPKTFQNFRNKENLQSSISPFMPAPLKHKDHEGPRARA